MLSYKLQPCHGGGPKFNTITGLSPLYISSGPQIMINDTPDELENLTIIPENTFGILYYLEIYDKRRFYNIVPFAYQFGLGPTNVKK